MRVAITDYNLDYDVQSAISVAKLVYTTELLGEQTVELSNWVPTVVDGKSIYTHEILVAAGDVLTDVSISARDNANNEALLVDCGEAAAIQFVGEKPAETEVTVFSTERKLVVDTLQPQVTVTKEIAQNSYVQTFNGNAYYNSPVTYRFQVQDNFLDLVENGGSIQIEAVYTDGTEILELKPGRRLRSLPSSPRRSAISTPTTMSLWSRTAECCSRSRSRSRTTWAGSQHSPL